MAVRNASAMTGKLGFSGVANAGLVLKSMTTAQRDGTTPAEGDLILNTTTGQFEGYRSAAYRGLAERGENTFTGQQILEVGAAGASPLIIRQTGGVAGTDEIQLAHDGTNGTIVCRQGVLGINVSDLTRISISTGGSGRVAFGYSSGDFFGTTSIGMYLWGPTNNNPSSGFDTGLERIAASIVGVNAGTAASAGAIQLIERTAPAAGDVNTVRLYAQDNGAGKTQLMALFNTGSAVQVAIEP